MSNYNLIINGASCTANSPWKTWADLVQERYKININNIGQKGLGNEAIITKALMSAYNTNNPIIVVMLTSVDKWDWYTSSTKCIKKINKEKHKGYKLNNETDGLYWSTGSWFPLYKKYYKTHYFSIRQMVLNTLKHILLLIKTCQSKKWPFLILNDYQIFDYTEEDLIKNFDKAVKKPTNNLIDEITKTFYNDIKKYMDKESLILIGKKNNLPISHSKFGAHPGTAVHYVYCQERVFPFLDKFFSVKKNNLDSIVKLEQKLWENTNK